MVPSFAFIRENPCVSFFSSFFCPSFSIAIKWGSIAKRWFTTTYYMTTVVIPTAAALVVPSY